MYKNFPVTNYRYDDQNNTKLVANIMRNVKFTDHYTKNRGQLFTEYLVKDSDKPESIANKVYGDPTLYWVILIFNNIFNPYFQWPLNRGEIEGLIQSKYSGSAIYMALNSSILLNADGVTKLSIKNGWFVTGNTIKYMLNGIEQWESTILSTDKNYNCIICETVPQSELGGYLVSTNKDGIEFRMNVGRIVFDNTYALHHFQDDDGYTMDPYEGLIGNNINTTQFPLSNYIDGGDLYSVPNRQHEENINDLKRKIYILRPEYLSLVNESLNNILNEQ